MDHRMSEGEIEFFREKLAEEERSRATIEKYIRDVKAFWQYAGSGPGVCKETVISYKNYLMERYAAASVNSMLAAVNCFFKRLGWYDCVVKSLKVQREAFRSHDRELTREEYYRPFVRGMKEKEQ